MHPSANDEVLWPERDGERQGCCLYRWFFMNTEWNGQAGRLQNPEEPIAAGGHNPPN